MTSGTVYEQGEILLVPFPFSDLSSIKQRPVLVLSKTQDNIKSEDLITCGITSNLKDSKYSVVIDDQDLETGKIPTRSRIKIDKLFTVEKSAVKKKLAKVNRETFDKSREEFLKLV